MSKYKSDNIHTRNVKISCKFISTNSEKNPRRKFVNITNKTVVQKSKP